MTAIRKIRADNDFTQTKRCQWFLIEICIFLSNTILRKCPALLYPSGSEAGSLNFDSKKDEILVLPFSVSCTTKKDVCDFTVMRSISRILLNRIDFVTVYDKIDDKFIDNKPYFIRFSFPVRLVHKMCVFPNCSSIWL